VEALAVLGQNGAEIAWNDVAKFWSLQQKCSVCCKYEGLVIKEVCEFRGFRREDCPDSADSSGACWAAYISLIYQCDHHRRSSRRASDNTQIEYFLRILRG
jgi:hypothetical protein